MDFKRLSYELNKDILEYTLLFPVKIDEIPKGRCAFEMYQLGDHEWSFYKDYEVPGTIDIWWSFGGNYFEEEIEVGVRIPNVWKKVNGSWNIVYGKPCYW